MGFVGRFCGRLIGSLTLSTNRRARRELAHALSTPPKISAIWSDLGCRFFQLLDAQRQLERVSLAPNVQETFAAAQSQNRGVLIATLHLGHWELMAGALSAAGHDVTAIAAAPKPGPLYDRLAKIRRGLRVKTLAPGGGARAAVEILRSGGAIGLFVDQNTSERGRPIRFFHREAHTSTTLERLISLSGCVPLFMWNARDEDGQYVVHLEYLDSITPLETVTKRCESLIELYPTQWVWIHDRWRPRVGGSRTEAHKGLL